MSISSQDLYFMLWAYIGNCLLAIWGKGDVLKAPQTQLDQTKFMIVLLKTVPFLVSSFSEEPNYLLSSTNQKTRTHPFQLFLSFPLSNLSPSVVH